MFTQLVSGSHFRREQIKQVELERLVTSCHVSLSPDEIGQHNDKNENKQGNSDSDRNNVAVCPPSLAILS